MHTRFCLCLPRVCFPSPMYVLVALWWVSGDLPQEGLCHTQVCCIQSACPCGRPLLTRTSTGDTQTLKGRSGSVSVGSLGGHQVLFEPCVHLWWVWGLILNVILPSNYLAGVSPLPLDVGYSLPPKMEKLYTMSKNKIES